MELRYESQIHCVMIIIRLRRAWLTTSSVDMTSQRRDSAQVVGFRQWEEQLEDKVGAASALSPARSNISATMEISALDWRKQNSDNGRPTSLG